MKKQLLFLSLAAALLAGCSKEAEVPEVGAPATHISAKAASARSTDTKAPLEGTSLNGQQAQVFTTTSPLETYTGDKTKMFTDAYAAGTMTFADNSYSQYDPAGLSGKTLLPLDKSEVYLYGFLPTGWTSSSAGAFESLSHTFDGKTDLMTTWVVPADLTRIAYQGGAAGTLPDKADFLFRHLLTRYNVQVKASDAEAQAIWGSIQSVTFKNANIDKVSTGETFGYTYSAGGGAVSFYKLGGTTDAPTYSDDAFGAVAFADMLALTTTYANACYTMAMPVDVDADAATAELTLVVETLDKDGGKKKTAEVPLSFDRTKLTAAAIANNTSGYSITIALNFRAGMIEASAIVEAWKDGGNQDEPVRPPVTLPKIGDLIDGGIVYEVNGANYKVFSLDQGSSLVWSAQKTYVLGIGDGQDETDGKKNMSAIKAYFAANTATVGSDFSVAFPAAEFCNKKNMGGVTGWYLPAKDELGALYTAYTANKAVLNQAITDNSGVAMAASGIYWSGTESSRNDNRAWCVNFSSGYTGSDDKSYDRYVRCVREN